MNLSVILFISLLSISAVGSFISLNSLSKRFFRLYRKLGQFTNYEESCNPDWINIDKSGLAKTLENELFGQEIAKVKLPLILGHYWQKEIGTKNLMLCFYGGPGTGKSFTAELIRQHMFVRGDKSYYYFLYSGLDIALTSTPIDVLKTDIFESIKEAVNECPYSVIVFDEADKYPDGFIDAIVYPFINGNAKDQNSFGKATFIFLTNVGESEIMETALAIKNSYFFSNTLENYSHIKEKAISQGKDSFFNSRLVKSGHMNYFIPFLPLDEESLIKCLEKTLSMFGQTYMVNPLKNLIIRKTLLTLKVTSDSFFISTGCKKLTPLVALEISQMAKIIHTLDEL